MKTAGEKLYDACRLWNAADFVPWLDAPIDLRDQVDKIAASFAASLTGTAIPWAPISSAPRDGVLLLWFPDLKDQEAQFGYWHTYEDAPWCPGEWRDRDNSEEFIRGDDARVHPTHWAPPVAGPTQ